MKNESSGNACLWNELLKLDLSDVFQNVDIPYYIMQGDTDTVTSTSQIQSIVDEADNPLLTIQIIKYSGHIPGKEGVDMSFHNLYKISQS